MISKVLVALYRFVHGRVHLRGAGWLLKRSVPFLPGLKNFRLRVPEVGEAMLDFRDTAVFGLLNMTLDDFGNERRLIPLMRKCLKPGNVLWDIGANVGMVSGYFANPNHGLRGICAFEPNPTPFKTLQSLFQNHPRVRVYPFGLGSEDGEFTMGVSNESSELGSLKNALSDGTRIQVLVRCGDTVFKQMCLPAPDVLKIDVEGFEPNVIEGLSQTIAEHSPVIFFEHTWLSDDEVRNLPPKNYSLCFIEDNGAVTKDFQGRFRGHDGILVPNDEPELFDQTV